MSSRRRAAWASRLVRAALRAWPRAARDRDGTALTQAFEDGLRDVHGPGALLTATLAECVAIVAGGLRMRSRAAGIAARAFVTGVTGDVRFAVRTLRRSPGFTLTVSIGFAIGIGANAAVFGLVDGALLAPPPFASPDGLVFLWSGQQGSERRLRVPAPDAAAFEARVGAFAALAFVGRPADGAVDAGGGGEHVRIATVTPDLFDVLGVAPLLGRSFGSAAARADDARGSRVGILSHDAWVRLFAADPTVVGRTVRVDGDPLDVVGVMEPGFAITVPPAAGMGRPADLWVPFDAPLDAIRRAEGRQVDQDSDNSGLVIARLADGVTLDQAKAEVVRVSAELRSEVPGYEAFRLEASVRPLRADATEHLRGLAAALVLAVVALLIVTCLNVSTLMLARGAARRNELSVRASLGAGYATIVRQVVVEAAVLIALGTVLARMSATWVATLLATWVPPELGATDPILIDGRLFGLAVVVASVATGVGLAPSVMARTAIGSRGAPSSRHPHPRASRARRILIGAQVAVSVVLVLATGLLLRTGRELRSVDPGFRPEGALTFSLSMRTPGRYGGPAERARLVREIEAALAGLPGVTAVGATAHLPLAGRSWTQPYGLAGQPESEWAANRADFRTVTSGYLAALGAHLVEGRAFTLDEDLREERRVVVVDRPMAARLAPRGSALGTSVRFPLDGALVDAEVVGVVDHVRHETLTSDGPETLFVPYRQEASRDVSFVLRTAGDPLELASSVRGVIRTIDEQLPVYRLRTLAEYVAAELAPTTFALRVLGVFAALVLAAVGVGLYGTLSMEVTRRTPEIGVRLALGARRDAVVRSIVARGLRITLVGVACGAGLSLALGRLLASFVHGVSLRDPVTWLGVLGTVLTVALLASWIPARVASRLDPTAALKTG